MKNVPKEFSDHRKEKKADYALSTRRRVGEKTFMLIMTRGTRKFKLLFEFWDKLIFLLQRLTLLCNNVSKRQINLKLKLKCKNRVESE